MTKHHIRIEKIFNSGTQNPFEVICDHEAFGKLIGANIRTTKEGANNKKSGLGSIRTITILPFVTFEETVTDYKENEYFEYKITKGSPLKNHIGKLHFSQKDGETHLLYTIDYDMKYPLPLFGSLLTKALKSQISKGLDKLNS